MHKLKPEIPNSETGQTPGWGEIGWEKRGTCGLQLVSLARSKNTSNFNMRPKKNPFSAKKL